MEKELITLSVDVTKDMAANLASLASRYNCHLERIMLAGIVDAIEAGKRSLQGGWAIEQNGKINLAEYRFLTAVETQEDFKLKLLLADWTFPPNKKRSSRT